MSKKQTAILFVFCAAAIAVALFFLLPLRNPPLPQGQNASASSQDQETAATKSGDTIPKAARRVPPSVPPDLLADVQRLARSNDPGRWREIEKYFSRLNPAQIWDLLTSPGVADQNESKDLQADIAATCGVRLSNDELGQPRSRLIAKNGVVDDFCDKLKAVGDSAYFSQKTRSLQQDADFLSDANNVSLSIKDMDTQTKASAYKNLTQQLFTSQDPWQAEKTIHDLAGYDDASIFPNSDAINAFSQSQKNGFYAALRYAVPCAMTGGCSAYDPRTVEYCSRIGTICMSGMSLSDAIQNNLPPGEIPIFNSTLLYILQQVNGG